MRRGLVLGATVFAALAMAGAASGFGTIRSLGQNAEHERITRAGLAGSGMEPRTLDEIAGRKGTFGGVGAPDRPDRGLMSSTAAHCDSGDWLDLPGYPQARAKAQATLEGCRKYIFAHLDAAVLAAGALAPPGRLDASQTALGCKFKGSGGSAKCRVLEELGMAWHASQDFYSHSNWVDPRVGMSGIETPPGLANNAPSPWLAPQSRDTFPAGLISGCYDGFPEALYCKGRVRHATLNKDTEGAPRGKGGTHALAMKVAADDTRAKWTWFEGQVTQVYGQDRGARILCVLRRDNPASCGG